MKKLLFLLLVLLASCTEYSGGYSEAELIYQANKLPVTKEDAIRTNFYGMGKTVKTRTTDAGTFTDAEKLLEAYRKGPLVPAAPIEDAWWVLLYNEGFYCDKNNGTNDARCDMPGFNANDPLGKYVFIALSEQTPNVSWCPEGKTHHIPRLEYKTNGEYTFVEIHVVDANGADKITKVYCTLDNNPVSDYYILMEDLAGAMLDFNDLVIQGGMNKKPRIIFRAAALPVDIIYQNKLVFSCGENEYGSTSIELDLNNMNTPNDWKDVEFIVNGTKIPVLLKNESDMPCIIGTYITYNFHKDENTMKVDEFLSIPFYK